MRFVAVQGTQVFWLGISTETWAIVGATALGPIAAILITRWRDWVREVRASRLYIFRTLLATRRQAITQEHVTALNLVEIEFYGVQAIEQAWQAYQRHLNLPPRDRAMTPSENKAFEDGRNDLLAKLLAAIASLLGFKMSEIDIRNGGYAPDGWRIRDERVASIQDYVLAMGQGLKGVPVYPLHSPSGAPAVPPNQPE